MSKQMQLASTIRDIIAPELLHAPSSCKVVTITEVELSADAEHATVYISALALPEKALAYLQKRQKKLQFLLRNLNKKRIPELRFVIDPRTEKGDRIEQ